MALIITILDSLDECANLKEAELLHQAVEVVAKMVPMQSREVDMMEEKVTN